MFAAGKTAAVSGGGPDAQFNYVTMLLHGDGTNGAQNNTFLDSSASALTITRNGNTTQGSFSPYGSNWSNYLGTSNYLSFANNANLNLGSGDFTIECWFFHLTGTGNGVIWSQWNNGGDTSGQLLTNGTGLIYRIGATQWTFGTFVANNWTHLAITRSGSTLRMFVNGVVARTETNSTNITTTGATVIGANDTGATPANFFAGYISNFRQVKGTAVYTSDFTPSTTPLTAITNTQLLICQSNQFKDNSTNNFIATIGGSPSVQRFNPFGTSAAYSTSNIGGSGYFDGTGDYLTAPSNTAFDFGTGNFTWEAWVYATSLANNPFLMHKSTGDGGSTGWFVEIGVGNVYFGHGTSGSTFVTFPSSAISINNWFHIAVTRVGTTLQCFVNGVSAGTSTAGSFGNSYNNAALFGIGSWQVESNEFDLSGYISNLRVVKGSAVYTSNFTPSTTPLTAISGTSLLLGMTNGAIFDNAMMNDLETVGNAQISTSVVKYGTGSLAFDGTGDYLLSAPSNDNILGGGDFTIEFWLYPSNTSSGYRALVSSENYAGTTGGWSLYQNGTSLEFWFSPGTSVTIDATSAITASIWQHVALCRASGTLRLFVNGSSVGSVSNSTSLTGRQIWIGDNNNGSYFFNGYMDDVRITKGYARYTANFTPPNAAFPNIGPY
jgi:hypothetical protein